MSELIARTMLTFAVFTVSGIAAEAGTIRRVDLNATGTPIDGSTWPRAYRDFVSAISASSAGDEVWVGQGVYFPHASNTAVSFNLKSGVLHKGGFAGVTETNPDDNDPVAYPTILSGDIDQDDGAGCAVNDAGNSEHVVTAGAVSGSTILEGFIIAHGNAGFGNGGGMQITSINADLQVVNCKFTCNRGWNGGGIDHGGSKCRYEGCTFEDNVAGSNGGGLWSGQDDGSELRLTDCTFTGNEAVAGGAIAAEAINIAAYTGCEFTGNAALDDGSSGGGAVYHNVVTDATIAGCTFTSNTSEAYAGALYVTGVTEGGQVGDLTVTDSQFELNTAAYNGGAARVIRTVTTVFQRCAFEMNSTVFFGGAMETNYANASIVDCLFQLNQALDESASGGALYTVNGDDPMRIINSRFIQNSVGLDESSRGGAIFTVNGSALDAVNCLFQENEAWQGGAFDSRGNADFLNCTFVDNYATDTGGAMYTLNNNTTARNCILWGNDAGNATGVAKQWSLNPVITTVTYCDVQDADLGTAPFDGVGNLNVNPLFVNAATGDFRLNRNSPCINAGDETDFPDDEFNIDGDMSIVEPTPDLDRLPRIVSNFCDEEPLIDMGSYEWQTPTCATPGDLNADSDINGLDIQPFVDCVIPSGASGTNCDCGDVNLDGNTTIDDIPCFVQLLLGNDACLDCTGTRGGTRDCNDNGITDDLDIGRGTSADCNGNFIPDECDVNPLDPDGNELVSADVDENGVPDECQPDCNGNNIPDVWDIDPEDPDGNEEVSLDCNENDIPDECERDCNENGVPDDCDVNVEDPDGDEWVSADCNENGVPDECEWDCNENGVPDDCDLDPEDPDGDEYVSLDCNENGYPDECDLTLPAGMGSYDCNENGVPDECDIADETSCDANANNVPDECDILLEACEDLDEDNCCDEESFMGGGEGGGGESMMSEGGTASLHGESSASSGTSNGESFTGETPVPQFSGPCAELSEAECWSGFYDWAFEQCWGPECETTGFEQFQTAQEKLTELGLP